MLEVPEPSGGVATELDDPVSSSVFRWWSYHMGCERWGFDPQRGQDVPIVPPSALKTRRIRALCQERLKNKLWRSAVMVRGCLIGEVDDELAGVVLSSVAGQFTATPPALAIDVASYAPRERLLPTAHRGRGHTIRRSASKNQGVRPLRPQRAGAEPTPFQGSRPPCRRRTRG